MDRLAASLPIVLAAALYWILTSDKGHWRTKLAIHLLEYNDVLEQRDIDHIKNLVEDVNLSIVFFSSYVLIVVGVLLAYFSAPQNHDPLASFRHLCYLLSAVALFICSSVVLFGLKERVIYNTFWIGWPIKRRFKNKILFDSALLIGYACWILIIVY